MLKINTEFKNRKAFAHTRANSIDILGAESKIYLESCDFFGIIEWIGEGYVKAQSLHHLQASRVDVR